MARPSAASSLASGAPGGGAGSGGVGTADDAAAVDGEGGESAHKGMSKYPSTPHLPFSPEVHDDDSVLPDAACASFAGAGVDAIITEKVDGGNCCLRGGKVYARTHRQEATHASFGPIKQLCERIYSCSLVPEDWWLFGENMFGVHSIEYDDLEAFFYLFAVRRGDGVWLAWDAVVETAELLGVPTVPVWHRGEVGSLKEVRRIMDAAALQTSRLGHDEACKPEGFVIRVAGEFNDDTFERSVAKYVRRGHVQTDDTWLRTWKKATLHAHRKAGKGSGKRK